MREQVKDGTAPRSFARDVLLHEDTKFKRSDGDAMNVAMQLIETGSDTTRGAQHHGHVCTGISRAVPQGKG